MRMNVNDKTERLELGNEIELRGNFIETETENGISYECDYYRTKNKTLTFEQIHAQETARLAEQNLLSTDWVENQLSRCSLLYGVESTEYENLFARRKDLLLQREAWVEIVRNAQG